MLLDIVMKLYIIVVNKFPIRFGAFSLIGQIYGRAAIFQIEGKRKIKLVKVKKFLPLTLNIAQM